MNTDIDTTTSADLDLKFAGDLAAGLRTIADFVEDRPDLASEYLRYCGSLTEVLIPVSSADDPRGAMAELIRAAKAHGATVKKDYDNKWGNAHLAFSPAVTMRVYAAREQVCERIVTGTETVTVKVPDPSVEVPLVEVEQIREIVEWRCEPLLAEAAVTS